MNLVTLYLIDRIIDLGSYFVDEVMSDSANLFIELIKKSDLKRKIEIKSFSNNMEISKSSSVILEKLENEE